MKRLLGCIIFTFLLSPAWAGIAVSTQTGKLSESATWATGNNFALPANYTDANVIAVSGTPGYTNYWTPSNAADTIIGVVFFMYSAPTSTATMTINLMASAVEMATATVRFCQNSESTNGPNVGPFFAKFATPVTYGDTTASKWRIKFVTDGQTVNLRRNAASQAAYVEVLNTGKTVASADTLIIAGNGTTAGTISAVTVSVDISTTIGGTYESILQGVGGTLSFSEAVSSTITCNNSIRLFSSYPGEYGLQMGTELTPLNSSYMQTIYFPNSSVAYGIRVNDERSGSYGSNYLPPAISIYGNPEWNMGGNNDNFAPSLAASVSASTNIVTFSTDPGLRSGGGDVLLLSATAGAGQTELVTVSSYDSANKKATLAANTSYAHSTGTYSSQVRVMSSNARIIGGNATASLGTYIYGFGGTVSGTRPRIEISNLEGDYLTYTYLLNPVDSTSKFRYAKLRRTASVSSTLGIGNIQGVDYTSCTYHSQSNSYLLFPSAFIKYYHCGFFASPAQELRLQGDASEFYNSLFDGLSLGMRANMLKTSNCRVTGASTYGSLYYISNSLENEHSNLIMDLPVSNGTDFNFYNGAPYLITDKYVNPIYSAATEYSNETYTAKGTKIKFQNIGNTGICKHRILKPEGMIESTGAGLPDTTVHTSSSCALKFTSYAPNFSPGDFYFEKDFPVGADSTVIFTAFYKMGTYTNASMPYVSLVSADGVLETTATLSYSTDWQLFTLSGVVGSTNTYATIRFTIPAPLNNSDVLYIDDILKTIASSSSGVSVESLDNAWAGGEPVFLSYGGGSFDYRTFQSWVWSTYGTDGNAIAAIPEISTDTIAGATQSGLDAQGYTSTRAAYLDNINNAELQTISTTTISAAIPPVSMADLISGTTTGISLSTATIANSVHDANMSTHRNVGTFGKDVLDIKNELRRR